MVTENKMDTKIEKLPISAIITGCNEAHLLEDCLQSISFCDTIKYVDLESVDNSVDIARKFANIDIIRHERVAIAEIIQMEYYKTEKHDWLLSIDPDERVDNGLYRDTVELFEKGIPENVGCVMAPCIFYFKKHPLKGTPWGGMNERIYLYNKHRYEIIGAVHSGRRLIEPYINYHIPYNGNNADHHYWMISYKQLFEKHRRYLKYEPQARYKNGFTTTLAKVIKTPFKAFKYSFYHKQGYKDGFTGLFLSLFWSWYQTSAEWGLYKYQKKNRNTELNNETLDNNS
ncbi:glycosyltransferase family protein [Viscerimonas tarda]